MMRFLNSTNSLCLKMSSFIYSPFKPLFNRFVSKLFLYIVKLSRVSILGNDRIDTVNTFFF